MTGSVTNWLTAYRQGDRDAAQALWMRYYERLVRIARAKLPQHFRRMSDEEDVALSAFDSFCGGLEAGRFPSLLDRSDLWRLLVTITARKATRVYRHETSQKRNVFRHRSLDGTDASIEDIVGDEPTPEFCALAAESLAQLLEGLDDGRLRQIAILKMEGYTNQEIAERAECSLSSVERKLKRIRSEWSHLSDIEGKGE
ncbi:MAG: RNA polymerase subunit sigma-70 [Planctomycetota bacterium]|nr:MAG: RNA polymerase subunit sigma-70 [Planctomycetota bacterium]